MLKNDIIEETVSEWSSPVLAITKWDLNKHVKRKHQKKVKKKENGDSASEPELSDEEEYPEVKKKEKKKYICHMCPEKKNKIFTIGTKLTSHLVKVHGVQWPFGHSRFRYQISEDGMYRLTTTRYESLEVSKKIVDGSAVSGPIITSYEFEIVKKNEATENTPNQIVIGVKGDNEPSDDSIKSEGQGVEITMCDVDEHGNIISSEVIQDVLYS
ncbi:unnamed protein product [Plutella xylostella]|uniref:(diamondback moth) hypothetical protein n=1 Tax=Plutella xylostella TaxID=51655 RepID=A0A8S4FTF7_PLUXY|nr:unnamed protein product [Plutella xylostella]